ncbi:DNA primase [termite gut metagenome]|uniref:DNA primase n=1 Tax=termite gut metagenome TaxID=433724 RepID=A0A5J4QQW1_9ZZZZ
MALQDIEQISIREYLGELGITPRIENKQQGMYCSPLRKENHPSFKVDYYLNLWRDFGSGEGGSIIDLVMKMENCSFHEAASKLEKRYANAGAGIETDTFSFHRNNVIPNSIPNSGNESTLSILKVLPITHPALIDFVKERKIDLELANLYCREIHYRINGRNYFGVGFRNDRGGYELSNPSGFKGCIPPKDITTIRNNLDTCLVFEGFWDFLSYLTLQNMKQTKHDAVILNSIANMSKAMDLIKSHKDIYTYLDNDEAGQKTTQFIYSTCSTVYNRSTKYTAYKDLNDYLCQKTNVKPEVKKKSVGFKR